MRPDPTYKTIFGHAFMVEELMRWLVADLHDARELVDALDFSRLLRVHEQSVTSGAAALHGYANDMVWRAPFRTRDDDGGGEAWLYLVMMLEFQSEVDFLMALRIRNYVDNFHLEHWRGRRFGARDRLVPVLPIVLYTGESRWTAAVRVIDLVTPGASAPGQGASGAMWRCAPLFAGDGYVLLDSQRVRQEDLRYDNAAALLVGLEKLELETAEELFRAFHGRVNTPELRELRQVMLEWASRQARRRLGVELGDMAELNRLRDPDEIDAYYGTRVHAWKEEYRAAGRIEGREEGRRESLRRYAEMKFDAETAARLGELLDGVADREMFDGVLAALFESGTAAEMLRRVTSFLSAALKRSR